jgi:hypothetical protein
MGVLLEGLKVALMMVVLLEVLQVVQHLHKDNYNDETTSKKKENKPEGPLGGPPGPRGGPPPP